MKNGNYELIRFEKQQNDNNINILVEPRNQKLFQGRMLILDFSSHFKIRNTKVNGVSTTIVGKKIRLNYIGRGLKIEIAY